ncbi:16S rRNA (cytidine(1402)-2'-O)-methyltransferase [Taibaiella sp. KBW10]|uniref:16S rRNA (cytidine(1402)-2'-O)-methyltransferase n=1 Tax=Taibaiella sp. KBW10 TaxID=2153357 RepID=UPI000F5ACCBF|nr:16S rRNA (cytidine(1402)-2'-O)-methyltransferase [Taibaiella sp. KBW10]RQO30511.1 16S rRNA (cytidine(1402)-2'-O)-methyltransferase [Taibaiella sp. KBW10]
MKLYLVPTPVGNLADITLRALDILKNADAILCEDTRTSGKLLKHYDIQKPLYSYHQHNEHKVTEVLVQHLQAGKTLALITDAGTPAISDPGFFLVRACLQQKIPVECLPGATAFVPALAQSGLPTNRFSFEGFLPQKKGRKTMLEKLALEERTIILYESPHRLVKCLEELKVHLGAERQASVSREISKMFEDTQRGTLDALIAFYTQHPAKGEIVMVIAGKPEKEKKSKYAALDEEEEEEDDL